MPDLLNEAVETFELDDGTVWQEWDFRSWGIYVAFVMDGELYFVHFKDSNDYYSVHG